MEANERFRRVFEVDEMAPAGNTWTRNPSSARPLVECGAHGVAFHGAAFHGVAFHGVAFHGVAFHGVAYVIACEARSGAGKSRQLSIDFKFEGMCNFKANASLGDRILLERFKFRGNLPIRGQDGNHVDVVRFIHTPRHEAPIHGPATVPLRFYERSGNGKTTWLDVVRKPTTREQQIGYIARPYRLPRGYAFVAPAALLAVPGSGPWGVRETSDCFFEVAAWMWFAIRSGSHGLSRLNLAVAKAASGSGPGFCWLLRPRC